MEQKHSLQHPKIPRALSTAEAAQALNRKPQTLRSWASTESGPIRPVRIHGRLAWPADQIALLLSGKEVAHG